KTGSGVLLAAMAVPPSGRAALCGKGVGGTRFGSGVGVIGCPVLGSRGKPVGGSNCSPVKGLVAQPVFGSMGKPVRGSMFCCWSGLSPIWVGVGVSGGKPLACTASMVSVAWTLCIVNVML